MGGFGSGRYGAFGGKNLTNEYRSIDIRRWKRDGLLSPSQNFGWQWSRDGEVVASINVKSCLGSVVLSYRQRCGGEDWKDEKYTVELDWSPCNYGGERPWFTCPVKGCYERVAILYGGTIFACRHCYRLAYPSQNEAPDDRAARRADKIRNRLGWEPGILNPKGWKKPKGMHWNTFERLDREHDALVAVSMAGMVSRLSKIDLSPKSTQQ